MGANKKTTMAKLNRERKLRERRMEKQARKDARKQGSAGHRGHSGNGLSGDGYQAVPSVAEHDAPLAGQPPGDDESAKIRAETGSGEHESTLRVGGSATGGEREAAPNEPGI
jgi:hypothetical protein